MTVNYMTRCKQLVDYLSKAGDSISYMIIRRIDTSIADDQLIKLVANDNTPVPDNLESNRCVQFAADNLDMQETTVDGQGSFHVTQMCAFQRGPPPKHDIKPTVISKSDTLHDVPPDFHNI